ncbi:MAG: DNA-3-methyladenine glycosylase [Nocardioidaceae bacterium]|nr:DNA-3-methyladenine glycosylase [Nocardioidaceae bacterium]
MLGWELSHDTREGHVTVRLTEVEAYAGEADPASHASRGRTLRTEVMFGPPRRLYVYFSYGMHWCANIVVGVDGEASAVLLRAGRVVEGMELARARRPPGTSERSLARGPACLTQALGIGKSHNGADLCGESPLTLTPGEPVSAISSGPRVGVSLAAEAPWRFWITGDETVSAYKRSPRAPA